MENSHTGNHSLNLLVKFRFIILLYISHSNRKHCLYYAYGEQRIIKMSIQYKQGIACVASAEAIAMSMKRARSQKLDVLHYCK